MSPLTIVMMYHGFLCFKQLIIDHFDTFIDLKCVKKYIEPTVQSSILLRMMVLCPERWAVRSLHSVYT